jgi:hypothetical protein
MVAKTTGSILTNATQTLAGARLGLEDVQGPKPERRLAGARNLVVFGRAVTNVLQNLRSTEPAFDSWYEPYVKEMEGDPLLRFLYKLRSEILKEGVMSTGVSAYLSTFRFPEDMARLGPPPPNAKSFFIGDQNGGVGWEVAVGEGQLEKYYVELPGDIGEVSLHLHNAPSDHLGSKISDDRLETICEAYIRYLEKMVRDAQTRFGGGA